MRRLETVFMGSAEHISPARAGQGLFLLVMVTV